MSGFVKIAYKIENYIGVFPALYPGVPNRQGAAFAGAQFAAPGGPTCRHIGEGSNLLGLNLP